MRALLAVAASLAWLAPAAAAQTETPEQVAQQFMAAASAVDWGRTASLMHPAALRQMGDLLRPALALEGPQADEARQQVFGFASRAAAASATDSVIFVALMRFAASQQPGLEASLRSATYHPLGSVAEGPDTVHVLGRVAMTVGGATVTQVEVLSLARAGTTWRALLKGDYAALAEAIRAAIERRQ